MKKIGLKFLIVIIIAGVFGYYLYNKPVDSLEHVKSVATLSADSIFKLYELDEVRTNELYLDKVITVTGKIQSVLSDTSGLSINLQTSSGLFGVTCKLDAENIDVSQFMEGQVVQVKGLCTGYLMDVVLIRCVVQE
jgi:tRNA_anti-like